MMKCSKCGNEIKKGQSFCTRCGNKTESTVQEIQNNKNGSEFTQEIIIKLADKIKNMIVKFKKLKKSHQLAIIVIIVLLILPFTINNFMGLSRVSSLTSSVGTLTVPNYNKIKEGMTYDEVVKYIGYCKYSSDISDDLIMCFWWTRGTNGNLTGMGIISFENGIVTDKQEWIVYE